MMTLWKIPTYPDIRMEATRAAAPDASDTSQDATQKQTTDVARSDQNHIGDRLMPTIADQVIQMMEDARNVSRLREI